MVTDIDTWIGTFMSRDYIKKYINISKKYNCNKTRIILKNLQYLYYVSIYRKINQGIATIGICITINRIN